MIGKTGRAAMAALMIALGCSHTQAVGECWSSQEISAAKVRDLQTMLMVSALRCRGTGNDVLAGYNLFVNSNREALVEANNQLKLHFKTVHGAVEGQRNYDRFTTALANAYGAGGSGTSNCADMASLAHEAASTRGAIALTMLAQDRGADPVLPSCRDSVRMAAR